MTTRIVPRPDPRAPVPLGLPQESFWTVHRLTQHLGGVAHNVRCDLRIHAPVEAAVVESALRATARRHEALRMVFREIDGRGFQTATDDVPSLAYVDLADEDDPLAASDRVADAELGAKFPLTESPPWRAVLMRLGPSHSRLVVTLHHIVCDGWSLRIVERELSELIAAFTEGRPADLADVPVQYGDFAEWQNRFVRRGEVGRQLRHWAEVLRGIPLALALEVGAPAPADGGGTTTLSIDAATTAALGRSARKVRATEFSAILAGLRIALHSWSGQDDVALSTAAAGRPHAEVADVVGCFFNTVVLRSAAPRGANAEIVRQTRNMTLEALRRQDVPTDMLLRALWLEEVRRGNDRQPMIEVGVRHEEPAAALSVEWIERAPSLPVGRPGPSRVSVTTIPLRGEIEVRLETPERFDRAAADDLAIRFHDAVTAIALRPGKEPARRRPRLVHDRLEFRGLRMDADALAAALARHPAIDDAFVGVADVDEPTLVAWVVVASERTAPSPPEVRRQLEAEGRWCGILPVLQAVPEIPRRAGRVARDELPDPPGRRVPSPVPPESPDELRLAALFERVLGETPANVHEHVFTLGGDESAVRKVVDLAQADGFDVQGFELTDASIAGLLRRARLREAT